MGPPGGPIFRTVLRFIFWSFLCQGCRSAMFGFQWSFVAYGDRKGNCIYTYIYTQNPSMDKLTKKGTSIGKRMWTKNTKPHTKNISYHINIHTHDYIYIYIYSSSQGKLTPWHHKHVPGGSWRPLQLLIGSCPSGSLKRRPCWLMNHHSSGGLNCSNYQKMEI